MSEPRRWKDSPDAPVGMRELLAAARPPRALDEGTFRRGAERVGRLSVAPAAAAAVSIWAKLAAAGAVGLIAAGSVVAVETHRPAEVVATSAARGTGGHGGAAGPALAVAPASEASASDTNPPPPATLAPEPPSVRAGADAPTNGARSLRSGASTNTPLAVTSASTPATSTPPPSTEAQATGEPRAKSSLVDELALLEAARGHLARSPETALAELAQHRARYPEGALGAERDLMELDALRRTGRVQAARDRARSWLGRDPNGMYAERVRTLLDAMP